MPHWKIKAVVQGTMAHMPFGYKVNYLLQRHISKSLVVSEKGIARKAEQVNKHLKFFDRNSSVSTSAATAVELGTGWVPAVPILLSLAGFDKIITFDKQDLLKPRIVGETIRTVASMLENGSIAPYLPAIDNGRAALVTQFDGAENRATAFLDRMGIVRRCGDARTSRLPSESVHLIASNNVFEHIPAAVLKELFQEFHRILGRGGIMSHFVDMADHYSGFDKSISPINFLQYSSRRWRFYNNAFQYQNRLRKSFYTSALRDAGFEILAEELTTVSAGALEELAIASEFADLSHDDLRTIGYWVVCGV